MRHSLRLQTNVHCSDSTGAFCCVKASRVSRLSYTTDCKHPVGRYSSRVAKKKHDIIHACWVIPTRVIVRLMIDMSIAKWVSEWMNVSRSFEQGQTILTSTCASGIQILFKIDEWNRFVWNDNTAAHLYAEQLTAKVPLLYKITTNIEAQISRIQMSYDSLF